MALAFEQQGASPGEALTFDEYLYQSGLGEDEYSRRNIQAAFERSTALLKRIEALPEGAPLGPGSYAHCPTLNRRLATVRISAGNHLSLLCFLC